MEIGKFGSRKIKGFDNMDKNIKLSELIKLNIMLVLIYTLCDMCVVVLFEGLETLEHWKIEIIKIVIILTAANFISLIVSCVFRIKKRRTYLYVVWLECIVLSLILLCSSLSGYYNIYGKVNLTIIFIYIVMGVMAPLLAKIACRKMLPKLGVEENQNSKIEKGAGYGAVAGTLLLLRRLTTDEKNVLYMLISLGLCFGWLFLGWFFFYGKKIFPDESNQEASEEKECC